MSNNGVSLALLAWYMRVSTLSLRFSVPLRGQSGLLLCMLVTLLAWLGARYTALAQYGLGFLPLAIFVGMLFSNVAQLDLQGSAKKGIQTAKGLLLKTGIALFGFQLSVLDMMHLGWMGAMAAVLIVGSTLYFSMRWGAALGLDRSLSILVGAGSAICGGAAIAATQSVLNSKPQHNAASLGVAVVFGSLGMFLLPWLFKHFHLNPSQVGLWIGLSVHELGHVVAGAALVGQDASASALLIKMLRVACLMPVMVWLTAYAVPLACSKVSTGGCKTCGLLASDSALHLESIQSAPAPAPAVPPFLWAFLLGVLVNSSGVLQPEVHAALVQGSQITLAMGLASLGLCTKFADLKATPWKVWLLGLMLWAHLLCTSWVLVQAIQYFGAVHANEAVSLLEPPFILSIKS